MSRPFVFTHRGLEPGRPHFFPESSFEAFLDHVHRGFGVEFDPNFVRDGIVIAHDATLGRLTHNTDLRQFSDVALSEVRNIRYGNPSGRIPTFDELLVMIEQGNVPLHALHLKGKFQNPTQLDMLLAALAARPVAASRILLFDVLPGPARYLKQRMPSLLLAPSVAHDYDVERYNHLIGWTLLTLGDALHYREEGLYDWVWLDEWDTVDRHGKRKQFYLAETFSKLKDVGYKIALVTPELHATSPGLYGGESHSDARDVDTLFSRIREIIHLGPDALCTDYPEEVRAIS